KPGRDDTVHRANESRPDPKARTAPNAPEQPELAADVHIDVLHLGVELEAVHRKLAAEATLLVATERAEDAGAAVRVDGDHAGPQALRDAHGAADVPGPDRPGEAIVVRVRLADDVRLVLEGDNGEDRAEDLLAGDAHVVADAAEDRRLEEVAFREVLRTAATEGQLRALVLADLDIGRHAIELCRGDDRAHQGAVGQRIANREALRGVDQVLHEAIVVVGGDEDAGAGGAGLAAVAEPGRDGGAGGGLQIGVGEDDVRALAAQLQRDLLDGVGSRLQDAGAGGRLAGEGDLVDERVRREGLADQGAGTGQDAHDAVRDAGLGADLAHQQGGERRGAGGLEDDGAAGGEGRGDIPGGHREREVPRHDLGADADRLAQGHVDDALAHRDRLAVELVAGAGVVLEDGGGGEDLALRAGQRLAGVAALDEGQLVGALADAVGDLLEDAAALVGGHAGPRSFVERLAGGLDGGLDILDAGLRDGGEGGVVGGVDDGEGLAGGGGAVLPGKEEVAGLGGDVGHGTGISGVKRRSGDTPDIVPGGGGSRCLLAQGYRPAGDGAIGREGRRRRNRDDIAAHVCGQRGVKTPQVVPYGVGGIRGSGASCR